MAIALGLFAKDGEVQFAMWEAIGSSYTPGHLCFLFAAVLINIPDHKFRRPGRRSAVLQHQFLGHREFEDRVRFRFDLFSQC